MKLGMLGINQILLLRRCLQRNHISVSDVKIVYSFSDKKRHYGNSNQKSLIALERLELYGLIVRVPDKVPWRWILTDEGRLFLAEKLPESRIIKTEAN